MTKEGREARGKANFEAGKFLNNSETLAYKPAKAEKEEKPKKEKKEA